MSFSGKMIDGICLLDIPKEYEFIQIEETIKGILQSVAENNVQQLILNFGKVSFLDSKRIGFLILLLNQLDELKVPLVLLKANRHVRELLKATNLIQFIPLFDLEEEALSYCHNQGNTAS